MSYLCTFENVPAQILLSKEIIILVSHKVIEKQTVKIVLSYVIFHR